MTQYSTNFIKPNYDNLAEIIFIWIIIFIGNIVNYSKNNNLNNFILNFSISLFLGNLFTAIYSVNLPTYYPQDAKVLEIFRFIITISIFMGFYITFFLSNLKKDNGLYQDAITFGSIFFIAIMIIGFCSKYLFSFRKK